MPGDWRKVKLSQAVNVVKGRIVPNSTEMGSSSQPYIGASALEGSITAWTSSRNGVQAVHTDVLMLWDGERSGLVATGLNGVISSTVARLRPNSGWEARYLSHFLKSKFTFIQSRRTGTGVPHVPKDLGDILELPLPPLPEQRRIAEILDTLDRTIEGTQRIIEKLQATRQGLLHDLLTRGLDEQGQLRDPEKHPEQFKDTELGRLPRAWEIGAFCDALTAVIDCPHTTPTFTNVGVPIARTSSIRNGCFDANSASHTSRQDYVARISRGRPEPGDIIFTREAPVGEAFVVPDGLEVSLGQRTVLLKVNRKRLFSDFLLNYIYSRTFQKVIENLTGGTTNPHLNVAEIRQLQLPLPSVDEQKRISHLLQKHDARTQSEGVHLAKLQALKRGLMQDLLTGRVRVPLPDAEVKDSDAADVVRPAPRIVVPNDLPAILPMPDVVAQPAIRPLYRAAAGANTQAMTEWTQRLSEAVQGQQVGAYSPEALDAVLPDLLSLTAERHGLLRVPEVLAKAGIRFMLLPHTAGSRSSGAAFYLDEPGRTQPVVGLSLRYPYLDVFWFNLLHELAHIRLGHTPVPDETLDEYDQNSPDEQAANKWAQDMLVPPQQWQWFLDLRPFKTQQMHGFARRIKRHISIVAGRYGHETGNWARMNELTLRHSVKDELTKLQKRLTGEVNP